MSSHREAPEDLQGPRCRRHRHLRVRQPGQPGHGDPDRELHPAAEAGRRPELLRVRRRRALRDPRRQLRQGHGGRDLPVPLETTIGSGNTFLYNTGPISDIGDEPGTAAVRTRSRRSRAARRHVLASDLACPPVNVGVAQHAGYAKLGGQAVHSLGKGRQVFAGQRADAFHVDLGSIFDLGALRPRSTRRYLVFDARGHGRPQRPGWSTTSTAIVDPGPDHRRSPAAAGRPTDAAEAGRR